ncbi:uncharacterized protein J3R85_000887 [Psidium guajava]|nr:uncharacterized protein J3R85_000887 [Psidium guajava]
MVKSTQMRFIPLEGNGRCGGLKDPQPLSMLMKTLKRRKTKKMGTRTILIQQMRTSTNYVFQKHFDIVAGGEAQERYSSNYIIRFRRRI